MDTNVLTQMIGSIGFPIVAFFLMYKEMQETRKMHHEEAEKWTEALNNNTLALQEISDMVKNNDK